MLIFSVITLETPPSIQFGNKQFTEIPNFIENNSLLKSSVNHLNFQQCNRQILALLIKKFAPTLTKIINIKMF